MGFVSWVKSVVNHVKGAAVLVSEEFEKLVGKDKAEEFAHASISILQTGIGKIVTDAVEAVKTLDPTAPGDAKKAQAFDKIMADAQAQGLTAERSIVHMLIELAVNVMKGHAAPLGQ